MPVLREPPSLEELGTRKACEYLSLVCRQLGALTVLGYPGQRVLEFAKRVLRPYYVNSLPGSVRSRMIADTSRSLYELPPHATKLFPDPTPGYLLTILLGPDVRRLKVHLCCYYGCSHQTDLLKLLAREGIGIERLELARSTLLRLDCQLLRRALHNMKNLRVLTLRNIASDAILETIGRSCPQLMFLDVACSQQVTDVGVQQLLLKLRVCVKNDPIKVVDRIEHSRKGNSARNRCNRDNTWSRIKTLLRNKFTRFNGKLDKSERKAEFLLDICETRNLICESLRIVNVGKTNVTRGGVLMLLSQAPNIESLGDYASVARAIENKEQECEIGSRQFELRQARDSGTTFKRLRCLAEACPRLEKLWIFDPQHSPVALRAFTSLTSLSLDAVPAAREWIEALYDYLRTNGHKLADLNLRVVRESNAPEVDLREILANCPNLVSLTKEGGSTEWLNGEEPEPLLRLEKIQIGDTISAKAVVNVLKLAPELVTLRVNSCNQLDDSHFAILRETIVFPRSNGSIAGRSYRVASNLTCFYVDEAKGTSAKCVRDMFERCKSLKQIGNLENWNLSPEEIRAIKNIIAERDLEVELCCATDWFWNASSA